MTATLVCEHQVVRVAPQSASPPCRRVAPLMCRTAERYADQVRVVRVNLTHSPALVSQYKIEAVPALVLLKNGEEIARHRGFIDRAGLDAFLGNL